MRYNRDYMGHMVAMCYLRPYIEVMKADTFNQFLADYRATYGPIRDKGLAAKLGVSKHTLIRLKQRGGTKVTAYACAALMHNLEHYKGEN